MFLHSLLCISVYFLEFIKLHVLNSLAWTMALVAHSNSQLTGVRVVSMWSGQEAGHVRKQCPSSLDWWIFNAHIPASCIKYSGRSCNTRSFPSSPLCAGNRCSFFNISRLSEELFAEILCLSGLFGCKWAFRYETRRFEKGAFKKLTQLLQRILWSIGHLSKTKKKDFSLVVKKIMMCKKSLVYFFCLATSLLVILLRFGPKNWRKFSCSRGLFW